MLSFDGRRLGISHHPREDNGRSVVYVLPSTGGTPRRVTARSPSYLHGWSPDGKHLVYTGERNGEFDIYRMAVEGGEEVRLTDAKGLDDGPRAVIRRGVPPVTGTVYTIDAPLSSGA